MIQSLPIYQKPCKLFAQKARVLITRQLKLTLAEIAHDTAVRHGDANANAKMASSWTLRVPAIPEELLLLVVI